MGWGSFRHQTLDRIRTGGNRNPVLGKIDRFGARGGDWWKHYHLWSNHDARAAEQQQTAAALGEQKTVQGNVDDLRMTFGDYAGNDPNRLAASAQNKADRGANYEHYRQAYLSYFNPQLDTQAQTAQHNDLFAGVNTGTSGGSADQIRQGNTLGKYVNAKAQLGAKANAGVNDLVAGDQQRELGLEDQIRHGGDASFLINQGFQGAQGSLNTAQQNIGTNTLGDVFGNAGNLYEQSQIAQARGRRGLSFSNSGGDSSGSVTPS